MFATVFKSIYSKYVKLIPKDERKTHEPISYAMRYMVTTTKILNAKGPSVA